MSQKFCNILALASLQHIYSMTEEVQAMVVTCCGSWCANILCIASFHVWLQSSTDEYAMQSNSGIYVLQVQTEP